jgi:hypothetical protein
MKVYLNKIKATPIKVAGRKQPATSTPSVLVSVTPTMGVAVLSQFLML